MKLGFGIYRHQLTDDQLRFAKQCGATHVVVHLVDYFSQGRSNQRTDQPLGDLHGWGVAGDAGKLWSIAELTAIKHQIESHGLIWEAVENFDPAHWHDVLLDGPKKALHLENCRTIIRTLGEVGIPVMGYNFSIAGVAGRVKGLFARGAAEAVGMDGPVDDPVPAGMVWNMWYDTTQHGLLPAATSSQLWQRCAEFLNAVLPVAEKSGVKLAAHPDDPPLPTVRGQPRLVYQPALYNKLIALNPSPANCLEFCCGTIAEMTEGDIYESVARYADRIAYVHLRNVHGKVPHYRETFIDDGDIDIGRVLRILRQCDFSGVIIPDHAPQMTCAAPWHAGMAFAMGYLKAKLEEL
ncbi:MAG: mannonate dehydratase [Verrucomicrobiota bacterium]